MNIVGTAIPEVTLPEVTLIEPKLFGDERGFFQETLCERPCCANAFHNDFTGLK